VNDLHRRLMIAFLLINSIGFLSAGGEEKKKPKAIKSKTLQVVGKNKGILKSSSGGSSSAVQKKHLKLSDKIEEVSSVKFAEEEINPQEWQTAKERKNAERANRLKRGHGDALKGRDIGRDRVTSIKFRRDLMVKGMKYDGLLQENKRLKRCVIASVAIITTGVLYCFSTMKSSNEEL